MLVIQRLRQWMSEAGRVTEDQIRAVALMFEAAFDAGLPSEDAMVTEMKPLLKRRLRSEAADAAIEEYGNDGDFGRVSKLIQKANTVGDVSTTIGTKLGSGSFDEIERLKHLERLPTGIVELDTALEGGMSRGELGIYIASAKGGKSMALSSQAAYSVSCGLFVVYATLELQTPRVLARIKAALLNVPINAIMMDPGSFKARLARMRLGPLIVHHFTPQVTTMPDIEAWVELCEAEVGRPIDVLITDYGDKLSAPKSAGREAESGYTTGRVVFERMRIYADERPQGKIWHWSASQARRQDKSGSSRGKKAARLDLEDGADSQHKVRVADLVITINRNEEDKTVDLFVAGSRNGPDKVGTGPLPNDYACGRLAPWVTIPEEQAPMGPEDHAVAETAWRLGAKKP